MAVRTDEQAAKKAVTAGAIGNFVEWYDYSVYGFFGLLARSCGLRVGAAVRR